MLSKNGTGPTRSKLENVRKVQIAIGDRELRADVQAKDWVGRTVASALQMDAADPSEKDQIKALLKDWIAKGWLCKDTRFDEKAKARPVIKIGKMLHAGEFDDAA